MALTLDEDTAPADFTGQGDARGSPFFKAMARELGGSPGVKLIEAGKLVKGTPRMTAEMNAQPA
jgi:hypothetical protein